MLRKCRAKRTLPGVESAPTVLSAGKIASLPKQAQQRPRDCFAKLVARTVRMPLRRRSMWTAASANGCKRLWPATPPWIVQIGSLLGRMQYRQASNTAYMQNFLFIHGKQFRSLHVIWIQCSLEKQLLHRWPRQNIQIQICRKLTLILCSFARGSSREAATSPDFHKIGVALSACLTGGIGTCTLGNRHWRFAFTR